ncbi:hypothetical protein ACFFIX_00755 [Metabacillus herbersteinensis]|uniref:Uncharacterized protein n=1 Tax=Metabacillus herbersteinensis TaxID=283816 RepID=A0ABV6G8L0_9BACI
MNILFGVELSGATSLNFNLLLRIKEKVRIVDHDDTIVIVSSFFEAERLKSLFEEQTIFEEQHALVLLDNPEVTSLYSDYGFKSHANKIYLFQELVQSFTITATDPVQEKMALLQFEEHLIAKDGALLYIDSQFLKLVQGIATAYSIGVTFSPRQMA